MKVCELVHQEVIRVRNVDTVNCIQSLSSARGGSHLAHCEIPQKLVVASLDLRVLRQILLDPIDACDDVGRGVVHVFGGDVLEQLRGSRSAVSQGKGWDVCRMACQQILEASILAFFADGAPDSPPAALFFLPASECSLTFSFISWAF